VTKARPSNRDRSSLDGASSGGPGVAAYTRKSCHGQSCRVATEEVVVLAGVSGRRRVWDASAVIEIDPFLGPGRVLGLRELCLCMEGARAVTFTQ
jgi:hypothetical protein